MTPTRDSEERLRAALEWSAKQMPTAVPRVPLDEHRPRRRAWVAIGAAVMAAAAVVIGLLWLPGGRSIDTVTTKVVDTGVPSVTHAPPTTRPLTTQPATTHPATTHPATTHPATTVTTTPPTTTYTVRAYDWVGSIADQFGITIDQLVALNGWSDGAQHVLVTGETILVPGG
jgi:LysM repeat protein